MARVRRYPIPLRRRRTGEPFPPTTEGGATPWPYSSPTSSMRAIGAASPLRGRSLSSRLMEGTHQILGGILGLVVLIPMAVLGGAVL